MADRFVVTVVITVTNDKHFQERFKPWPGEGGEQPVSLEERVSGFVGAELSTGFQRLAVVEVHEGEWSRGC